MTIIIPFFILFPGVRLMLLMTSEVTDAANNWSKSK